MDRFEHFVWSILLTPKKKSDLLVGSFQTGLANCLAIPKRKALRTAPWPTRSISNSRTTAAHLAASAAGH
jgi:hypothetical protein